MNFIVSSTSLLKQLQAVGGVLNSSNTLPILDNFLFEITDGLLTVSISDLETTMMTKLEVQSEQNGKIAIPAKLLLDVLKNLPDQPCTFKVNPTNFQIEIAYDNGKSRMVGFNGDEFPKVPELANKSAIKLSGAVLSKAINKTLFATGNDDLRPVMSGVYCQFAGSEITFVATDAHKLVRYKRTDAEASGSSAFILPKKPLNLLKNALPDNEDPITLSFNNNHLFVDHGSTQLICRLIDARFPDYKVVIPADNPYRLTVNKHDFQNALRRVNVFSNKSTNQVALNITGNELQMAAQDIDFSFEGNERMSCEYKGEDIQIAFNAKFLIEMLSAADTDDIFLELSTPSKAGLIKPSEQAPGEDLLMLVMPLMLNS